MRRSRSGPGVRVLSDRVVMRAGQSGRRFGTWALDAGFGHPRGVLGRVGAVMMVAGNAAQESEAIIRAGVRNGERVLIVGAGPGLGIQRAAARVGRGGHVAGIDPSPLMCRLARRRCRHQIDSGIVEIREAAAERTGCADHSVDAAISVNNVMLWQRPEGFAELARVLAPGGRLVISVHRHVLPVPPEQLVREACDAGFVDVDLHLRARRRNTPAVELVAYAPSLTGS